MFANVSGVAWILKECNEVQEKIVVVLTCVHVFHETWNYADFHVVIVQWRQKRMMHVRSCCCCFFSNLSNWNLLFTCRSRGRHRRRWLSSLRSQLNTLSLFFFKRRLHISVRWLFLDDKQPQLTILLCCKAISGPGLWLQNKEKSQSVRAWSVRSTKDTAGRDFSSDDCFLCVILNRESKDETKAITSLFSRDKCPSLDGKPKLFLFEEWDGMQTIKEGDSGPPPRPDFLGEDDFLVWYRTPSHNRTRPSPIRISSQNYYFRWLYNLLSGMHLTDAIHDTEKKFPTQSWLVSTLTKKVFFRRN